jgi:hypothetical protein
MDTTVEEKKIVKRKKKNTTLLIKQEEKASDEDLFPETGPILMNKYPDFLSTLYAFFIVGHKYVALRKHEGKTHPCFFILLDKTEDHEMFCRFVKYKNEQKEQDKELGWFYANPLWEDIWMEGWINTSIIWNCLPFDENREYSYHLPSIEKIV